MPLSEVSIKFAAFGDLQAGNIRPSHHGTREDRQKAFMQASGEADILILPGDLTQNAKEEEIIELIADVKEFVTIPVIAITGNHDRDSKGQTKHITRRLHSARIPTIDDKCLILNIKGVAMGLVGLNPTLTPQEHDTLLQWYPHDPIGRMEYFHETTARRHLRAFRRNLAKIQRQGADVGIIVSHIPFSPDNYAPPSIRRHTYMYELSPRFVEVADKLRHFIPVIFGAHVHAPAGSEWSGNREGYTPGGIPSRNGATPIGREYGHERMYDLYEVRVTPGQRRSVSEQIAIPISA